MRFPDIAVRGRPARPARWPAVALLFLWACLAASAARAGESYTLAVVPQFDQRKLHAIWKPIVDEVARRTGYEIRLVAPLTVRDFEQEIAAGTHDFVYANPYHILRASARQGYIPLVHDKAPLRGILVVQKAGPIRELAELDGKTLAVPSLNALGASLMVRADLERLHNVRMRPLNVKTHTSVYLQVANGLAAAGGGVEKTLMEQDPAVRDRLRILYTTREMPSHPVAAHPRVPAEARNRVQAAFVDLAGTESGRALLGEVPILELVATSLKDFLPMRAWGLEAYWVD